MDERDSQKRLPIGQFAALAELSTSQLRAYDELGLLVPEKRDPSSGYRYYRREQLQSAELIRLLRDLAIPLAEIQALLDGGDLGAIDRLLRRQRDRMLTKRLDVERIIARLDRALRQEDHSTPVEPWLTHLDAQWVISRRLRVPSAELDDAQRQAARQLRRAAAAGDALGPERGAVLYHGGLETTFGPIVDTEVCLPILSKRNACVKGAWLLPGGEAATLIHRGPWVDARASYIALYAWIVREGFGMLGPPREAYLVSDEDTDDPREYVTQIMVLIGRPQHLTRGVPIPSPTGAV